MPLPLVYHPQYSVPLPPGHRFPMPKFGMLAEHLRADGFALPEHWNQPEPPPRQLLELVHEPGYVARFIQGELEPQQIRRIGLPWSEPLAFRTQIAVAGTLLTAQLALKHQLACHTAGGTHHAFPDAGSGFCIFNDLAVAARALLETRAVNRILILDLDVHQGDGTAWVFRDEPRVFTFSMHCQKNFPMRKQQSDLDVPLPLAMADEAYLATLQSHLEPLLERVDPDLVLYDAGVDPHENDKLGRLKLTDTGLWAREQCVLRTLMRYEIPTACVIGGGYGENLHELVGRHSVLHRVASEVFAGL